MYNMSEYDSGVKTLTANKFDVVKLYDPALWIGEQRKYFIEQGALNDTYQYFSAQSATENYLSFQCTTPSPNVIMDRRMYLIYRISLQDTSLAATQVALNVTHEGLRPVPMTSASQVISFSLNGINFSWQPDKIINAMLHYYNMGEVFTDSVCPFTPDQFVSYMTTSGTLPGVSARNPFNNYEDTALSWNYGSRNVLLYNGETTGGNGVTNTFSYTCVEPVIISPLEFGGKQDCPGLIGCSQFALTYNFDPSRLWSGGALNNTGAVTLPVARNMRAVTGAQYGVFGNQQPLLAVRFMTPPLSMQIPPMVSYPLYNVDVYVKSKTGVPTSFNSPFECISDTLSLNTVPHRIYLFARIAEIPAHRSAPVSLINVPLISDNSPALPETFAPIVKLNITFNNITGILSNTGAEALYNISLKNGLFDMTFPQFTCQTYAFRNSANLNAVAQEQRAGAGSVVCLSASELSLGEDLCSGCLGKFNYQVNSTHLSPFGAMFDQATSLVPVFPKFDQINVVVSEGMLTYDIARGVYVKEIGAVSSSEVMHAPIGSPLEHKLNQNMYGGSIFSKLKSIAQRALPIAKKVAEVVGQYAPQVANMLPDKYGNIASQIGRHATTGANVLGQLGFGRRRNRSAGRRMNPNRLL